MMNERWGGAIADWNGIPGSLASRPPRHRLGRASTKLLQAALVASAGLVPLASVNANETIAYTYDARGRLKQVAHSGSVNSGITAGYIYDKADNRTNVTVVTPPPSFSISDASATEGGSLSFAVTRSGTTTGSYSVNYTTGNGTANAGSDYTATSGTLTFAAGETLKTITVSTIDDSATESSETLSVTLSNPTGGAALSRASATGTVVDNDTIVYITGNHQLNANQSWSSPDGRFRLVAQSDFNVVLYQGATSLWSSGTAGAGTMGRLLFQGDGNLVLYDNTGAAKWSTSTSGHAGAVLAVRNDGNVVIYSAPGGTVLWQTNTCCH